MDDLISVIIPVYKVEEYLPRCLDSVISQTYKNLEIILVDDGSPDNCGKICDEYEKKDKRIKVIHKENGGVSSARNMGLDNANGTYISFIDSDDYIDEKMYEVLLSEIKSNNFDMVECSYSSVYEDGTEQINSGTEGVFDGYNEILYGIFNKQLAFFVLNKLIKKSVAEGIRFDTNFKVAEDLLFFFECAKKDVKLKYVNKPFYKYFQRKTSVMNSPFHEGVFDIITVLEIIDKQCNDDEVLDLICLCKVKYAIDILKKIDVTDRFTNKYVKIRKIIVENRKKILKSKNIINRLDLKDKFYIILVGLCPFFVRRLYQIYYIVKRKHFKI